MGNTNSNSKGLGLGIAKAVVYLIGSIIWFVLFVGFDASKYGYKKVKFYPIFEGLDSRHFDKEEFFLIVIIAIVVISVIILFATLPVKGIGRGVFSVVVSVLSLILIILVVSDAIIHIPGNLDIGAYTYMGCCVIVFIFSVIDLVLNSKTATNINGNNLILADPKFDNYSGEYSLVCISGEYLNGTFPIYNGEFITIGRDPAVCSIVISEDSQYISSIHCSVKFENGVYQIYDQSKNGVMVNGEKIPRNIWHPLPYGTVFTLAKSKHSFRLS